jgi:hypothetical protein
MDYCTLTNSVNFPMQHHTEVFKNPRSTSASVAPKAQFRHVRHVDISAMLLKFASLWWWLVGRYSFMKLLQMDRHTGVTISQ